MAVVGVDQICGGFRARLAERHCFSYARAQKGSVATLNLFYFFGGDGTVEYLIRTTSEAELTPHFVFFHGLQPRFNRPLHFGPVGLIAMAKQKIMSRQSLKVTTEPFCARGNAKIHPAASCARNQCQLQKRQQRRRFWLLFWREKSNLRTRDSVKKCSTASCAKPIPILNNGEVDYPTQEGGEFSDTLLRGNCLHGRR